MSVKYRSLGYEIVRYEVHLFVNGNDLGGNNFFDNEEEAVEFAVKYVREYPDWTASVRRVEKLVFEEVE